MLREFDDDLPHYEPPAEDALQRMNREHLRDLAAAHPEEALRVLEGSFYLEIARPDVKPAPVMVRRPVIEELTRDAIGEFVALQGTRGMPRVKAVQAAVAHVYGVPVDAMVGDSRTKHLMRPRHEAMYWCAELFPDMSIAEIGRRFGRDHTTVLHAIKKYCHENRVPHPRESQQVAA